MIGSSAKPLLEIYTDGSCLNNPGGFGGWGVVIVEGGIITKILSGGELSSTSIRMELTAILRALKEVDDKNKILVYTDSQHCVDWVNNRLTSPKHQDIWKDLIPIVNVLDVKIVWVQGHNGHPLNVMADKLATDASTRIREWANLSSKREIRKRSKRFGQTPSTFLQE